MRLGELSGKRVAVWGEGLEGRAAARAAAEAGAKSVTVFDETTPGLDALVRRAEVLILSPGVSAHRREVLAAREEGIAVTSGTELYLAEHGERTVAITGSKGKSTTARLLGALLEAVGVEHREGGNLGQPLLELRDTPGLVVAEVSSYQAALLHSGPRVGILTSLFPDHLPWHGNVERYYSDKLNLLAKSSIKLVNSSDPGAREALGRSELDGAEQYAGPGTRVRLRGGKVLLYGEVLLDLQRCALRGGHNESNVAGAVAALLALGVHVREEGVRLQEAIEDFEPLPHRLQTVTAHKQTIFVDDTLATTPQAAVRACEAFPDQPLALLAGGLDRGVDPTPLREYLSERSSATPVILVAMGEMGEKISRGLPATILVERCDDVEEGTRRAARHLGEGGGVVLFSPAAASPREYGNYAVRAAAFKRAAQGLAAQQ